MSEIEISKQKQDIIQKSIENTNNALNLLSNFIVKNEILAIENLKSQSYIASLKNNIEELKKEIKQNYKEDKVILSKIEKLSLSPEMIRAEEAIKDVKMAMGLMKLIAANITDYSGDPTLWYRYTEVVKRLDEGANYLP
jgi:hypothetical protein